MCEDPQDTIDSEGPCWIYREVFGSFTVCHQKTPAVFWIRPTIRADHVQKQSHREEERQFA
jgi:hypothetical protein